MRALLRGLPLALMIASPLEAQTCPEAASLTRGFTEPLAAVRYLADDALQGRMAGTRGERCAAEFIAARFRALGLKPAGTAGTFFQDVPLASAINPHAPAGTGRNVLALLEGTDAAARADIVVIGAHYDHLGHGGIGSMSPGDSAIHNGADDNASGVAAMLRAAALLTQEQRPARSVLFMAFTGEESGLLGSAHFTRSPTVELAKVRAMINMDMVGRLGGAALIVNGVGTATQWRSVIEPAAARIGLKLALKDEGWGPSDQTSFYAADIPVLHLFTNTHGDYHKPSDDWQRIDGAGLEKISQLVASVTRTIATSSTTLSLVRTQRPTAPGGGGYGAYLGTVPDFAPVDRGVLLGGVTGGSPAEAAGLKKGDILLRLGTHDVKNLEAFTAALQAHRPGDTVEVVVLREGREVKLRATLGRRGA
jgi:hypothetical protein